MVTWEMAWVMLLSFPIAEEVLEVAEGGELLAVALELRLLLEGDERLLERLHPLGE